MSSASTATRRVATVLVVVASLILGFGAIRASAAWTAASAPLSMSPASAESLQARLADETERSSALRDDLAGLMTHAQDLTSALDAAQARIDTDAGHAAVLAKDLAKAKAKLAALERSIRQARAAQVVRAAAPRAAAPAATPPRTTHHDDGGDDGDG